MLTRSSFDAIPENKRPWPDFSQVPVPYDHGSDRYNRAIKAGFMISAGGFKDNPTVISGAGICSAERDLEQLTAYANRIAEWFKARDCSCWIRISQGDYGWFKVVREVNYSKYGDGTIEVKDVPHSELHLT